MNGWIVFAAIASTAITALLTWVLYRINATTLRTRVDGLPKDPVITASHGDGGRDDGGD
ncbi:MAG: hypothetical protein ACREH4_15570 [Vitreimonas sp.]